MTVIGRTRKGEYFDSITLMNVGRKVSAMEGVEDAAVVMGTAENKGILKASDLMTEAFESARDTDLLIAVRLQDADLSDAIFQAIDDELSAARQRSDETTEERPMSLRGGLELLPDANLAVISVAGRYAGDVAMQALEQGLHVMLFSDNVPIEKEVELKEFARDKGLLVMGPDCGTAIINGVPLAFANVVPRGRVGIVAASGTGLQEVSCLLANEGCGISQAIGTGGRDVKNRVGGIMFLEALKALGEDEDTDVIVLIAKPPDATVLQAVDALVESLDKPVVSILLGADRTGLLDATTLEEAALMAAALTRGDDPASAEALIADREAEINKVAEVQAQRLEGGRQYVRGLFSGGTFCTEAQLLLADILVPLYANAPVAGVEETEDLHTSKAHTLIDMGEDEFTVGRPHPMIDYSLRNKRIAQEAADPETAVILLDVVLGYGSNMDPASELEEVVREAAGHVAVVCSVTGTAGDPQDRAHVVQTLEKAGAVVLPSNASACRCAGHIIRELEAAS